ncbi:MAG: ABC transporter permease [Acidobacteria bacterium]|nr:MAG: ABC transporter permease [Acidobacteriota bacterium]
MGLLEGIRLALRAIWVHKLRSGLTLLANVVAVMSVIAVVSILSGMDHYVKETIFSEGSGIFYVSRVDGLQILTSFDEFLKSLRNPRLKVDDADYLRQKLQLAEYVGTERDTGARLEAGDRYAEGVNVRGRTFEYAHMREWNLVSGRHLAPLEVQRNVPVAVIGHDVAETLFPNEDPIGKTIRAGRRHLRVMGVIEEQGQVLGSNQDLFIFVPLGVFEKMFGNYNSVRIAIKVADLDQVDDAMAEVAFFMRIRHRLGPKDRQDFVVISSARLIALWEQISRGIFMTLTAISSISLLIGGIIIMNIMLVSVTERTREIGIRKAVGARRSGILLQIMAESVALSMAGGVVGTMLGFGVASLVAAVSPLPYSIELWSITAGVLVTGFSGLVFGIYPANRAARLDPIDALRVE